MATPARRLRAPVAHEAIADHLRRRILAHELPAGAPIDEAALARSYGVLRACVREALNLLFGESLVERDAAGGLAVTRLGAAECRETLALRALLRERASEGAASDTLTQLLELAERRARLAQGAHSGSNR